MTHETNMLLTRRALTLAALIALSLVSPGRSDAAGAAPPALMPAEGAAISDVQRFLELRTGSWSVDELTKSTGRETYEMDVTLGITIHTSGSPRKEDLENDPWLAAFAGKAGERKSVPVTLTWARTPGGWKLKRITPR
jgi:hypothetical protein